jgi:hypothetical protein
LDYLIEEKMTPELLDKYADIFFEGIKLKLSQFLIEGREMYFPSNEVEGMKEIMKEWLTDFYNESNGQG